MVIEQTVDIPASRRLTIDVPPEIPAGRTILTFELQEKLRKLRGSLPNSAFGGLDGVSYQRKVREEWNGD